MGPPATDVERVNLLKKETKGIPDKDAITNLRCENNVKPFGGAGMNLDRVGEQAVDLKEIARITDGEASCWSKSSICETANFFRVHWGRPKPALPGCRCSSASEDS